MLEVIEKKQSQPCNYATFTIKGNRGGLHEVVLCDGHAISCSTHRRATSTDPCEHMRVADQQPDINAYWQPYSSDDDFSDLFDN